MYLEKLDIHKQKHKPIPSPRTKFKLKWITDLNVKKPKTTEFLEENTGEKSG